MKFITLAVKGMKELVRDRKELAMILLFPVVFVLVFGYAFGASDDGNTPHKIVVLNHDKGTVLMYGSTSEKMNFGENFTDLTGNLTYENSTVNLFEIQNATEAEAENLLMKREIACIIIIPENFSDSIYAMLNVTIRKEVTSSIGEMLIDGFENTGNNTHKTNMSEGLMFYDENGTLHNFNGTIPENGTLLADAKYFMEMFGFSNASNQTNLGALMSGNQTIPEAKNITSMVVIKGDMGYIEFGITQGIMTGILDRYLEEVKKQARDNVSRQFNGSETQDKFVFIETEGVSGTEAFTIFDFMAPGFIILALLMSAISVASTLARETDKKTLTRLKITKMKSYDLMLGTLIPWTLMSVIQVLIILAVAVIIGFHWQGGWEGLIVAIFIGSIAAISSVSLGLIISSFANTESHASTLGVLIAIPLSFLAGAFFPINKTIVEILPWGHAVEALRAVLIYGNFDILYNLGMMLILTIVLFTIGVILFQKKKMKAEI
ncbi:MAG: hypothetical protein CVT90_00610 [Candidatus Altiarchaeales archaeon HGW-Altiarchaeales-3]|nr:MAG: hypothetical protein CVT90_00610 [Candidatus Altiarchaeales archaeon HGW-Altiarchaeales-3]